MRTTWPVEALGGLVGLADHLVADVHAALGDLAPHLRARDPERVAEHGRQVARGRR